MKSTKKLLTLTGLLFLSFILSSITVNAQTVKDINGKVYKTCKVGMQEWTSENLNVNRFRNGDAIPQVKTDSAWEKAGKAGKPAWCYYSHDTVYGKKFGKLYNFYALTDPRGLAPKGWHSPTIGDWSILVKNLLGVDVAGIKLKSITDWNQSIKGSNLSGFTAIPGGMRNAKGSFKEINKIGQWWTTQGDLGSGDEIWSMSLNNSSIEVNFFRVTKETGLSVRCLKD